MDRPKRSEDAKLANGSASDNNPTAANNVCKGRRFRSEAARVFEPRDSNINRLVHGDHNFQAVYDVCAVHVVLFTVYNVVQDSLAAGRLSVDLPLFYLAMGDFNIAGIAAFVLTELLLLSMAVSVHPALMAWKTVHTEFHIIQLDMLFLLVYMLGLASSLVVVLWVVFTVPLCPVLSFVIGVEQVRLSMKTYSYVRETAKKVLTPWNKDDTSGPAVVYAGQMEPKVGSLANYLYFLFVPTLLYRDRYPRNDGPIKWMNAIAYLTQCIAILWTAGVLYDDLVMPASLSHASVATSLLHSCGTGFAILVLFNVGVLHSWMNLHAELLRFADRQFYTDWWTATSYAAFYRKWNTIVHDWIHAYIYTDAKNVLSACGLGNIVPAFLSIAVSSAIHEYLLAIGLGFCMPFLSVFFGGIGALLYVLGPCVVKRVSSTFILLATGVGMGFLTFCYMLEYMSRQYCPQESQLSDFFISSRYLQCYPNFN